jgi:hypothetical protein
VITTKALQEHPGFVWTTLLSSFASIAAVLASLLWNLTWWVSVPITIFCLGSLWYAWTQKRLTPAEQPVNQPQELGSIVVDPPLVGDPGGSKFLAVQPAKNDAFIEWAYGDAFFSARHGQAYGIEGAIEVGAIVEDWVNWQYHNYVNNHPQEQGQSLRHAYYKKACQELLSGRIVNPPALAIKIGRWVEQQVIQRASLS